MLLLQKKGFWRGGMVLNYINLNGASNEKLHNCIQLHVNVAWLEFKRM